MWVRQICYSICTTELFMFSICRDTLNLRCYLEWNLTLFKNHSTVIAVRGRLSEFFFLRQVVGNNS